MMYFYNYLIVLAWAIVVSVIMALAYGVAIWILDKMLAEVKTLRHLTRKPIAMAIVLAAFILGIALVIVAVAK